MRLLIAILIGLLPACSSSQKTLHDPTLELQPGVVVTLVDADTGDLIDGATLLLSAGTQFETMQQISAGTYDGAVDAAGTYALTVTKPGYQAHATNDIRVEWDGRRLNTQRLTVELNKASVPIITENFVVIDNGDGSIDVQGIIVVRTR